MASEETPQDEANENINEKRTSVRQITSEHQSIKGDVEEVKVVDERKASEPRASVVERKSDAKSATAVPRKSVISERSIHGKMGKNGGVSRDVVSIQESKKSIVSLGPRPSKDTPKDLFARRKSSRSIGRAVGSIISFRRGSIAEYFDRQKTAKFMNTYKLESDKPFNVDKVEKILKEVLIEALDNLTYDLDKVPKQVKWASSAIRTKVKEQEYDRYKLICNVTIGEKRSQDMYATYRFLWDAERDKHASYIHENMYVFAIAVCFGIYYE